MATMNVSLPEQMKAWVEKQGHDGRYANVSDYVRDLIRKDKDRQQKIEAMQVMVQEGIESGVTSNSMTDILRAAKSMK